jgi:Tfp pilus assembly protein PilO
MKRLPPAKRNQLIGVVFATIGLICLVYFLLINPQNDKNNGLANSINLATTRLQEIKATIKQKDATQSALDDLTLQLNHAEEDVASGDLYQWSYDTIRRFKATYHVDIPAPSQPAQGDCDLLANFPYKQIRFTLTGIAYYHDLGKFVSEFENKFPHCRVLNLSADPIAGGESGGERLNFRMDIVALVKPNS